MGQLLEKLPWREGLEIYESYIPDGATEKWAEKLIKRWLPEAKVEDLAPALHRAALYYWSGRTIKPLGRQANKRPVNWEYRTIIWLLGFVWEFYGRTCGTASSAPGKFEGFVWDAIRLIEPGRKDPPGRQAFRTTRGKRPHLDDL